MKYRVCVYAICKNEEQFVQRWLESMKEADEIVVLDTGSDDRTVELLREGGVTVYQEKIVPWRFDTARNRSLALVPETADICVCTDLDEVFLPGWREKIEAAWGAHTRQLQYRYTWNFNPDGSEGYVFWISKIHARRGFYWKNPVHEVLCCREDPGEAEYVEGVQLHHHADDKKSRGQYLPLLELAVEEDPTNDRNMHYLGREYFFYKRYEDCIRTLTRHLSMPSADWRDERCASLRMIAKSCEQLGRVKEAENHYWQAVAEAPYLREPWLDFAKYLYRQKSWEGVVYACNQALAIEERPRTYISEAESFGSLPYDLISLGYYYTGQYAKALQAVDKAISLAPGDERLQKNRQWIQKAMK